MIYGDSYTVILSSEGKVHLSGIDLSTHQSKIVKEDRHTLIVHVPSRRCVMGASGFGSEPVGAELMVFRKLEVDWSKAKSARYGGGGARSITAEFVTRLQLVKGWASGMAKENAR